MIILGALGPTLGVLVMLVCLCWAVKPLVFPNLRWIHFGAQFRTIILKIVGTILGIVLMIVGFLGALIPLGFSTFIDPGLSGNAWWAEYWATLSRHGGIGGVLVALLVMILGAWLASFSPTDWMLHPKWIGPNRTGHPDQQLNNSGGRDEYF